LSYQTPPWTISMIIQTCGSAARILIIDGLFDNDEVNELQCNRHNLGALTPEKINKQMFGIFFGAVSTFPRIAHSISGSDSGITICAAGEELRISLYEPARRIPHPKPSDWRYPKWTTSRLSAWS
jgi:hypothetical protein